MPRTSVAAAVVDGGWDDGITTKESVQQNIFMRAINAMPGCYCIKIHGDVFTQGEPDVVGSYAGLSFACEFKRGPREPLRPLQKVKLARWEKAFAFTGVFWRATDALEALAVHGAGRGLGQLTTSAE